MASRSEGVGSAAYATSSVKRMSWAALLAVERWLRRVAATTQEIDEWLSHLWRWSVTTEETFVDWYEARPDLLTVEQTGQLPDHLIAWAERQSTPADELRTVLFAVTDIVYATMFGGINWEYRAESLDAIAAVLARYDVALPPPDCLPGSDRNERNGWGDPIDQPTLDSIRRLDWTTGC